MKMENLEISPKNKDFSVPVLGSAIYDNRSTETINNTLENFDNFLSEVSNLDYWKSKKDPRFEQYGGIEIEKYQNDVGLLGQERAACIKSFLSDKSSLYQQGKFLKLLRKKLNQLNFDISVDKSNSEIFKMKEAKVVKDKREKIFFEYENIVDDLLRDKNLNYVILLDLLKTKEWMHSSCIRNNEEYSTPFRQARDKELIFDGAEVFVVSGKSEEIELLRQEYSKTEEILRNTDNYIKENSSFFHRYLDILKKTKEDFLNIKNESGLNLKDYLSKRFPSLYSREKLEQEYFDFLYFISKENYESLRNKFEFNPENLSIEEQFLFLSFVKNKSLKEVEKIQNFTKIFKENGFRTFLSIEHGGKEMGDEILFLSEELLQSGKKEIADKIFAKYGEYIDVVDSVEDIIKKEYKVAPSQQMIEKTKEALLVRGKNLLLNQAERIANKNFSEASLLKSLDNTHASVDLFKNIFRIAKENDPQMSFEDFVGLNPEIVTSIDQITKEEIGEMQKIIEENYPDEDLRNAILESFQKAISFGNNQTHFNLLKRDGKIIAFDRVDKKEDGTLYFGSFNVDPKYCSSKIGDAFFQATVAPLMKDKIIKADCSSRQPIAAYYVESGFVANSLYDYNNEPSFSLESNFKNHFLSKDFSRNKIIEAFLNNEKIENIIINSSDSQEKILEHGIPKGHLLTRYFFDKNARKWFSVLEKISD